MYKIKRTITSCKLAASIKTALEFLQQGNLHKAEVSFRKILRVQPDNSDALHFLGVIHYQVRNYEDAISYIDKALQISPSNYGAHNNLGLVYKDKGQLDKAESCFEKALQINPHYVDAYNNLGVIYKDTGQLDKAGYCFEKVLQLNPDDTVAYNNLGTVYKDKGQFDESETCFEKALKLHPNFAEAHVNLSNVFLLYGNLKQGWKEYEWRWKTQYFLQMSQYPQPLWDGSDLSGRTILLHAEQGFGDTIQFIRYAPLVAERGARVILECHKDLVGLLQHVEGISQVVVQGNPASIIADMRCPLMSLPFMFDTQLGNISSKVPYITVGQQLTQQWKDMIMPNSSEKNVGLVWSGNPGKARDRYRSCPLHFFRPLAAIRDITLYSLQKGEAAQQADKFSESVKLVDFTHEIHDFLDTAAFIRNLDLVITVDTAVAHLAGALGKPVWTLLPFIPDWRWMLTREDTPWYPTMRLFRQPSPGDWDSVIFRITENLQRKITERAR